MTVPVGSLNAPRQIPLDQPGGWEQAVASALGIAVDPDTPKGQAVIAFLSVWSKIEGTAAKFNPLATTQRMPGSTTLPGNSAGVQEYATPQQGIQATAQTLRSYPSIVLALKLGDPSRIFNSPGGKADLSRWSTGHATPYNDSYINSISSAFYDEKSASDWTSFDLTDAGHAVKSAVSAVVNPFASAIEEIITIVKVLTDPETWKRAGLIILGGVAALLGAYIVFKSVTSD